MQSQIQLALMAKACGSPGGSRQLQSTRERPRALAQHSVSQADFVEEMERADQSTQTVVVP